MSGYTAYCDFPNGERIELPASMPDVGKTDGPLCDGKFELPDLLQTALLEMIEWWENGASASVGTQSIEQQNKTGWV